MKLLFYVLFLKCRFFLLLFLYGFPLSSCARLQLRNYRFTFQSKVRYLHKQIIIYTPTDVAGLWYIFHILADGSSALELVKEPK